jgi:hypothetical protein
MRFQVSLAIAATLALGQGALATVLGNGLWSGVNYANGTTVYESLDNPAIAPVIVHNTAGAIVERSIDGTRDSAKLRRRFVDCWNYNLDHAGTDMAVDQLKDWAGKGRDLESPASGQRFVFFENLGVWVYYCINKPSTKGNLDTVDVNYALEQMVSTLTFFSPPLLRTVVFRRVGFRNMITDLKKRMLNAFGTLGLTSAGKAALRLSASRRHKSASVLVRLREMDKRFRGLNQVPFVPCQPGFCWATYFDRDYSSTCYSLRVIRAKKQTSLNGVQPVNLVILNALSAGLIYEF